MRVSSKIIAGFIIMMLLGLVIVAHQLSVINQMQSINQELSEIDFTSALAALEMRQLAVLINDDSDRYFVVTDTEVYHDLLEEHRKDFRDQLALLNKNARSEKERNAASSLSQAFDDYWALFNQHKGKPGFLGRPADLTNAIDRLDAQTEVTYLLINVSIKEQVAQAALVGQRAVRLSRIAVIFSLLLAIIISAVFVRAISDPLRRLTQGTRAIAKGQFWHRLPAHGVDEFAELARDFNVMSERLGDLDRMKKDFVSHVSHDLKAPLASMRQVMHLMLQEIPGPLSEQQKSLLGLSYNSAERLSAMVGNLLDVSRMEAGSMEYQMGTYDLLPVIKSVIDEFEVQAREKGIRFRLECEGKAIFVKCDRDRIVQVVGNLYENALKFSPADSEIITRITLESKVRISVADAGPGVPDGHKKEIFNKFHQVKYGKKIAGQGVGLGLAICKTIVEAHGGPIWVEDNPGGGSVFSFVLYSAAGQEVVECGQSA